MTDSPPKTHVATTTTEAAQENEALLYEVGQTLTIWMGVEAQIRQTFVIALGVWQNTPAFAVYRAAVNLNARMAMADEAVKHCLSDHDDQSLVERWKLLHARAKKLAKRRNAVAHGQVSILMGLPDSEGQSRAIGARVIDPMKPPEHGKSPQSALAEGISVAQLKEMQGSFQALGRDLFDHGQELYALLRRLRESREH